MADRTLIFSAQLNTGNSAKKLADLRKQLLDSTEQLKKFKQENKDPSALRANAAELARLEGQVKKTRSEYNRLSNATNGIKANTSGLRKAFTSSIAGLGLLTLGTTALISVFKDSVQIIKGFEQAIADLSAITGASGEALADYQKEILKVSASTGKGATEIADAFRLVGSAQPELLKSADALGEVTEAAIILSQAGGIELQTAVDSLTKSMNQFGADASEAATYIDILATSQQKGTATIEQLGESMVRAGGTAKAFGLSFEETNVLLQGFAKGGVTGSEAGTQLSGVLSKLAKVTQRDLNPAQTNALDVINNLSKQQLSYTDLLKLTDAEGAKWITTLINQNDQIQALRDNLNEQGAASEQAATRMDTLAGRLEIAKSTWERFVLSVDSGNGIISRVLRNIVQAATDAVSLLERFNNESDKNDSFRAKAIEQFQFLAGGTGEDFIKVQPRNFQAIQELTKHYADLVEYTKEYVEESETGLSIVENKLASLKNEEQGLRNREFDTLDEVQQRRLAANIAAQKELRKLIDGRKQQIRYNELLGKSEAELQALAAAGDEQAQQALDAGRKQQELRYNELLKKSEEELQALIAGGDALAKKALDEINAKKKKAVDNSDRLLKQLERERELYEAIKKAQAEGLQDESSQELIAEQTTIDVKLRWSIEDLDVNSNNYIKVVTELQAQANRERDKLNDEYRKKQIQKDQEAFKKSIEGQIGLLRAKLAQELRRLEDFNQDLDGGDDSNSKGGGKRQKRIRKAEKELDELKIRQQALRDEYDVYSNTAFADGIISDDENARLRDAGKLVSELGDKIEDVENQINNLGLGGLAGLLGISQEAANIIVNTAFDLANDIVNGVAAINAEARAIELQKDLEALDYFYNAKQDKLRRDLDNGLITEAEYENQRENITTEQRERQAELKKEAWIRDRNAAILTANINTALAVLNALATGKQLAPALAIAAGAAGAVQVALIAAQPVPEFRKGGQLPLYGGGGILHGPSHENGGIPIRLNNGGFVEAEGGEFITNTTATQRYLPLLQAINSSATTPAPVFASPTVTDSRSALDRPEQTIRAYVQEADVTKTQKRVSRIRQRAEIN